MQRVKQDPSRFQVKPTQALIAESNRRTKNTVQSLANKFPKAEYKSGGNKATPMGELQMAIYKGAGGVGKPV